MAPLQLAVFLFLLYPPYQLLVLSDPVCSDSEFQCTQSTLCIDKTQVCDGVKHCPNEDDEFDCEVHLCLAPNFFKCRDGGCVSSSFTCDNANDCPDGSDEENCTISSFTPSESSVQQNCSLPDFLCADGQCIISHWVCDGDKDCADGSDETESACKKSSDCDPTTDFLCRNHVCIVKNWVCDGANDCLDNSDEENCPHKENIPMADCLPEHELFRCRDNTTCVEYKKLCDGNADCSDGSDEGAQCSTLCPGTCHHKCFRSPSGPICQCPLGTRAPDCIDINECLEFGICDQKCNNTYGSYSCSCEPGFVLDKDGRSCKVSDGGEEALLYFSTYDEVRTISLTSERERSVATGLKHVAGVACDGDSLYWTSIFEGEETIIKSKLDGSGKEMIVSAGLGSPEDIAVDWLTRNVYFTDLKLQHIGVCENRGEHCAIIVNADIDRPRGIALLPAERIMFWSDWGKLPMIATSGMDGSNARPFIKDNIHWPNDITIDYPGSRIYWIDAKLKIIETIKLDGTDRRVVLSDRVKHPFSIDIFGSTLYWSDWLSMEILACNKFTGRGRHVVKKEKDEQIYGVHVYHPVMHRTNVSNPCAGAPCSDLCLLAPNEDNFSCLCPQEKLLLSDRRTCESRGRKPTLVLGQGHTIMLVEHQALGKQHVHQINLKSIRSISALTYDVDAGSVIISDTASRKISYLNLDTGEVSSVVRGTVGQITALDYDNLGSNLYWIDTERGTVEVMNMKRLVRTVLLQDLIELPVALALVPKEGYMFVAFSHNHHVHIDRIRMDGSLQHRTHVIEDGLLGPHISLHYDEDLDRVFWADAFTGAIESTDVEGLDRFSYANVSSPMGLATVSNDLFWSGYQPNVMWANKFSFDGQFKNFPASFQIEDWSEMEFLRVTAAKGHASMAPNPCADFGGCSDICLLAGKTHVCSCPAGKILSSNGLTCEDLPKCASDKQFQCNNGQCIALHLVCNGHNDCAGGEDEQALCKPPSRLTCPELQFPCQNGERCIDVTLQCNSVFDCSDKSDEFHCNSTAKPCTGEFDFQCGSGECITRQFLCDKKPNCLDGSDEDIAHCMRCGEEEFRCESGSCIPKGWVCDGQVDCTDGSDERATCDKKQVCGTSAFSCENGNCIPVKLKCDGQDDCGDRSDEQDCPAVDFTGQCLLPNFQCTTMPKLCLPATGLCNGTKECSGGEDETGCNTGGCDPHFEFECDSTQQCIPNAWLCDHQPDCTNGEDEIPSLCVSAPKHLQSTTHKPKDLLPCAEFSCDNGQCLRYDQLCNKHRDCEDGSDEGGRCNTGCSTIDCDGACTETPKGPLCHCKEGFILAPNGRSCADINECAIESMCAQNCVNVRGSYECACVQPEFLLRPDHTTCKAVGSPMEVLYTINDQLRKVSQSHLKVLFDYPGVQLKGLDVDVRKGLVYWSSGDSGLVTQFDVKTLTRKLHISGLSRPERLALDWVHNIVYIVEAERKIMACQMARHMCVKVYSSLENIHISALSVDPINGYLFWAETSWLMWDAPVGVLKRCDLSGANTTTLVEGGLSHVTSIAVNDIKKLLYWTDNGKKLIEQTTLDGEYRKRILDTKVPPLHVVIFEDTLYYVTNVLGSPFIKCRIYGNLQGSCEQVDIHVAHPVTQFTISQVSRQRMGPNNCANSTCSHLCLESLTGPVCLCPDGSRTHAVCGVNMEDPMLTRSITFRNHTHEGVSDAPSGSGTGLLLIIGLVLGVLTLSTAYHLCLRKRVGNLVPKIHFRNTMFNGGYSESNLRNRASPGFMPSSPPAMTLPNLYEPMEQQAAPVQFRYANEMSIKHGDEEFWNTRRHSESSAGTDYAEIQDNQKLPLL